MGIRRPCVPLPIQRYATALRPACGAHPPAGDIDPAIVPFLMREQGLGPDELDALMNRKSGFLGMAGTLCCMAALEKAPMLAAQSVLG